MIYFSGNIAHQATHDLPCVMSFVKPTFYMPYRFWLGTFTARDDNMQYNVGLPVPTATEPMTLCFATEGRYRDALSY